MADVEIEEVNGTAEDETTPVAAATPDAFSLDAAEDSLEDEEKKKAREPPIVYKDLLDVKTIYLKL